MRACLEEDSPVSDGSSAYVTASVFPTHESTTSQFVNTIPCGNEILSCALSLARQEHEYCIQILQTFTYQVEYGERQIMYFK